MVNMGSSGHDEILAVLQTHFGPCKNTHSTTCIFGKKLKDLGHPPTGIKI